MHICVIYLLIIILLQQFSTCKEYSNYSLYRVIPVNENDLKFLTTLHAYYDLNFWREPGSIHRPTEFVINPSDQPDFLKRTRVYGIYFTTLIQDVQRAFNQQTVQKYIRRQMTSMNWNNYFRLEDIYNWLIDLSIAFPNAVQIMSIGRSHENREILAVKVTLENGGNRSTILIEGGIHAREWISPAVVTYLIHSIVHADSSNNTALKRIAYNYDWYFVPILNPDGYEFTHTNDRLWRKNRNGDGVDLNRNFGYMFGTTGVSWFSSSDSYCGPHAFSEKESMAMSGFIKSKLNHLEYYVAFHAYGQYMILPYGHLKSHAENYDEMYSICQQVARRIEVKYKTAYQIGTPFETVGYTTSGVSGCWVKKTFRVPYVVTFELRDNGYEGFTLPPSKILPTCEKTLDGLVTLFNPRKINHTKIIGRHSHSAGQTYEILEYIVIGVNTILFIIVRFD